MLKQPKAEGGGKWPKLAKNKIKKCLKTANVADLRKTSQKKTNERRLQMGYWCKICENCTNEKVSHYALHAVCHTVHAAHSMGASPK